MESSMEAISAQGTYKEILLLWINLVSHLIHCVEMVSLAILFHIALLVSFANTILVGFYQLFETGEKR